MKKVHLFLSIEDCSLSQLKAYRIAFTQSVCFLLIRGKTACQGRFLHSWKEHYRTVPKSIKYGYSLQVENICCSHRNALVL